MSPDSKRPVTAAEIKPEWIAMVRGIVQRDGQAVRPSAPGRPVMIEVQGINTGQWQPLGLPAGGCLFTTAAERDIVLQGLIGKS